MMSCFHNGANGPESKISKYSKSGHLYSAIKYYSIFQSAQVWQHTVLPVNKLYVPLLHSRRASPPFGWYSFYCPIEGRRLSRPVCQVVVPELSISSPALQWHCFTSLSQHYTYSGLWYWYFYCDFL